MHETLLGLLDPDAAQRRQAVEDTPAEGAYMLRDALLDDPDATVRARAAERLGTMGTQGIFGQWLEQATGDDHATVREAACRALARMAHPEAAPRLARVAAADAVWSVRRAAVLALAASAGKDGVDTLLGALDDPFWRVRHAAIQALGALAGADEGIREHIVTMQAGSQAAGWALEYLRRGLAGEPVPPLDPAPRPEPVRRADASIDPAWDPDPAVVTARLEDPAIAASRALVLEAIADSHEPLRKAAMARLRDTGDARMLRAALAWLDEPRIPHAADAVRTVLDDLGDGAAELAAELLEPQSNAGPGAVAWALAWIGRTESHELGSAALAHVDAPSPMVRAAALDTLGRLVATEHDPAADRSASMLRALVRGTCDPDVDARLAAVRGLAGVHAPAAYAALAAMQYESEPVAIRRVLASVAAERGDMSRLGMAARDDDTLCRALAISALDERSSLDADTRARAKADPDPWLRMAALDLAGALAALGIAAHGQDPGPAADPDPRVRRVALDWLIARCHDAELGGRAGLRCAAARDPLLRSRACRLLDPSIDTHLEALLALSADTMPMVRAAAADRLDGCADLDARLRALLTGQRSDTVRVSAYTWLGRALDRDAGRLVAGALTGGAEPPRVAEHLRAMLVAMPEAATEAGIEINVRIAEPRRSRAAEPARAHVQRRPLGQSSITVAPLAISGAFDLAGGSLAHAHRAGVDLFFWEPRYAAMTRFLRASSSRRQSLTIAAGSFHGSAAAIEADVHAALRRLRTDYLDIFLLFWVRSPARLSDDIHACMRRLVETGKVRAAGFSTHDRGIAADALRRQRWDVVMLRHSAAHRGIETCVLPVARERGVGVLTFSALCYGRMLRSVPGADAPPSPADCYRYSLSQDGVSACISAPRRHGELVENLEVLGAPTLDAERLAALREHGRHVHDRNRDFNALIRREPRVGSGEALAELIDEVAPAAHF